MSYVPLFGINVKLSLLTKKRFCDLINNVALSITDKEKKRSEGSEFMLH